MSRCGAAGLQPQVDHAWQVLDGAPARAQLRGNPGITADLAFVRVEPYVQPKRSLTGAGAERVDSRVLQVIHALDPALFLARVGPQVDVCLDADGGLPVSQATP